MSRHPHLSSSSNDPTFKAKSRSTWEIIRRVAVYLRPYRWMAAGTMTCALPSGIRRSRTISATVATV